MNGYLYLTRENGAEDYIIVCEAHRRGFESKDERATIRFGKKPTKQWCDPCGAPPWTPREDYWEEIHVEESH